MQNTAISPERRQTRSSIYRRLYEAKEVCTKASLAAELGLSLPTIYQNLNELISAGLVQYAGEQRSTGGRRAKELGIVCDARVAVGISITESSTSLVLADLKLNELAYRKLPRGLLGHNAEFSRYLARELERFLDDNQVIRAKLLGVGIALAAVISPDGSKVVYAPTLGLQNVDLSELAGNLPYPVFFENDGNCGGLAECFIRGGYSNMAYLSLENGVGGAVIIGGATYSGNHCRSGEFGHMCVEPAGLPCMCGKRGCLEAYCSARRISDALGITLEEFFQGVNQHVPEYEALWYDLLRHLAIGVNTIHMTLDCDVVLGGFLTEYLAPYMPRLKEYIAANNPFQSSANAVHLSVLRRHSVPLGVALHFVQEFLDTL